MTDNILFSLHRAGCVSTALCLLQRSACCLHCMLAFFCLRPRGSLCQSSCVNFTGSISKARKTILKLKPNLSISWAKYVFPQPCRQTFSPETCSHTQRMPYFDLICISRKKFCGLGAAFHIFEKHYLKCFSCEENGNLKNLSLTFSHYALCHWLMWDNKSLKLLYIKCTVIRYKSSFPQKVIFLLLDRAGYLRPDSANLKKAFLWCFVLLLLLINNNRHDKKRSPHWHHE